MVAPYTWILSLVIISPLQTVDGFLEEVDKKCEGTIECALHSECESYKEAVKQMKTLPEQSCQQKEGRQNLKGRVCNKVFQMSHYLIIIFPVRFLRSSKRLLPPKFRKMRSRRWRAEGRWRTRRSSWGIPFHCSPWQEGQVEDARRGC